MSGPVLGTKMHSAGIVLRGSLDRDAWINFPFAVAQGIGMEAVGDPAVWDYPVEGKGGVGMTVCQPITESFIVLDTWSAHDGAYLFVCSCRGYFTADIDAVAKRFGLKVECRDDRRFYQELRLG